MRPTRAGRAFRAKIERRKREDQAWLDALRDLAENDPDALHAVDAEMTDDIALVAMRLADMGKTHPFQDNSRTCSKCGSIVGIYPSGQNVLRHRPTMKVICARCYAGDVRPDDDNRPAAPMGTILQEMRDSRDVGKA